MAEMQQIPPLNTNPNPNSDPFSSQLYTTTTTTPINYAAYYAQNPNLDHHYTSVDPTSSLIVSQPHPPGVEATPCALQPPVSVSITYAQQNLTLDPNVATDAAAASYYVDQNVVAVQSWIAAVRHLAAPYAAGVTTPNQVVPSQRSSTWIKRPKKTKVVQSAWCEICRIDCNSKGVLDQHKLGKKHKKNLEKLKGATAIFRVTEAVSTKLLAPALTSTVKPVIGPEENPKNSKSASGQNPPKKAAEQTQDLETKKRKVLEGGAAAASMRTCIICNVVCNSETVYNYHLAGQKHSAMIKKHASIAGVAFPT